MSVLQLLSQLTPLSALALSNAEIQLKHRIFWTSKSLNLSVFLIHLIEKHDHVARKFPNPLSTPSFFEPSKGS